MRLHFRLPALVGALALAALAAAPAAAAEGPIALVVNSDDPSFSWLRIQASVAEAIGAPVVATDDPGARQRRGLLTIAWRPSRRELAVTYEDARGTISRVVPAPDDAAGALAAATELAENLVRDQAAEALGAATPPSARPRAPATAEPLPSPAPAPRVLPEEAAFVPAPPPRPVPRWMLSLSVGTGVGWAGGSSELLAEPVASGFGWARAGQIEPEVGFRVVRRLVLSVAARYQRVTGTTDAKLSMTDPANQKECGGDYICEAPRSAFALLAKATIADPLPADGWSPYYSFAVGGGAIRHTVAVPAQMICGPSGTAACVDSLKGGPFLMGVGAGLRHRIAGPVAFVGGLEALLGAPDFTFNVDANIGAAVAF